jgi:hypothetical protein
MRSRLPILSLLLALLSASCRTKVPSEVAVAEWPASQVFKAPQECGGYQEETLELKDDRFRYWLSTDDIVSNPLRYPIEGNYDVKGDQLVLRSGETYTLRTVHGSQTLWRWDAVVAWDRYRIIDHYGILLPVGSMKSRRPMLKPFFTKEQWHHSDEQCHAPLKSTGKNAN